MQSSYNVLIVDDDAEVRRSLVHLFERAKWQVNELSNAINGAKKIINISPDVVISDVKMPNISGLQLFENALQVQIVLPLYLSQHMLMWLWLLRRCKKVHIVF